MMDIGGGPGFFGTLLIGGLAGWIAGRIMKADYGLLTNLIVGIIGAFLGAWLANLIGLRLGELFEGWFWGNLIVSVAGATLLIGLYRALHSR